MIFFVLYSINVVYILIDFHILNQSFISRINSTWILGVILLYIVDFSYFVKDFFVSVPEGYCFVIFFSCDVLSNFGFIE